MRTSANQCSESCSPKAAHKNTFLNGLEPGDIHVELCIIINNYARFVYGRWLLLAFLLGARAREERSAQTIIDGLTFWSWDFHWLAGWLWLTKLRPSHEGAPDVRGRDPIGIHPSIGSSRERQGGRHPTQARWGQQAELRFSTFPFSFESNYAGSIIIITIHRSHDHLRSCLKGIDRRGRPFLAISLCLWTFYEVPLYSSPIGCGLHHGLGVSQK